MPFILGVDCANTVDHWDCGAKDISRAVVVAPQNATLTAELGEPLASSSSLSTTEAPRLCFSLAGPRRRVSWRPKQASSTQHSKRGYRRKQYDESQRRSTARKRPELRRTCNGFATHLSAKCGSVSALGQRGFIERINGCTGTTRIRLYRKLQPSD
jgi:hypothetical protein